MELRRFELLTPCMPCKCSSQLSYSPSGKDYSIGKRYLSSEKKLLTTLYSKKSIFKVSP